MVTKHRFEQDNRNDWLNLRASLWDKVGGSELGIIAGHSNYTSPFTFFCQKLEAVKTPDISDKEAIIQGHDGEQGVADRFEREMGKRVHRENCIYTNDKFPHLKASIDRKITGENSGLECKTAKDMVMKNYKHGDFPMSYFDQCLLYLTVTELDRWYLAIQVFGTGYRMFLMTTKKDELDRYNELKEKFSRWEEFKRESYPWKWNNEEKTFVKNEQPINPKSVRKFKTIETAPEIPSDIVSINDADIDEWEKNWSKLEAVYYVDAEEKQACETISALFMNRIQQVYDIMEGKTFKNEDEELVALIAAIQQVWPQEEIDGSESTEETIGEITPDGVEDSVITMDESDPSYEMVLRHKAIIEEEKALKEEKNSIEAKLGLKMGSVETALYPGWKVTYKAQAGREFGVPSKIKEYFASRGESVPDGMITISESSRSVRFYTSNGKKKSKK